MSGQCGRSERLEREASGRERDGRLANLEVPEGETRVLSYSSEAMRSHYVRLEVRDIDHLAELIGTPNEIAEKTPIRCCDPRLSSASARLVSSAVFNEAEVSPEIRAEAMGFARLATEEYLYGNRAAVQIHKDLLSAYLDTRAAIIFAAVFGDITVQNGAVLKIASNTLVLRANRIRMFGSGAISCDGPTTFDCHSLQGGLTPGGSFGGFGPGGFTAPTLPIEPFSVS